MDSKGRPKEPDLSESGCPSSDQYLDVNLISCDILK